MASAWWAGRVFHYPVSLWHEGDLGDRDYAVGSLSSLTGHTHRLLL